MQSDSCSDVVRTDNEWHLYIDHNTTAPTLHLYAAVTTNDDIVTITNFNSEIHAELSTQLRWVQLQVGSWSSG